jgi:hypothetical protein
VVPAGTQTVRITSRSFVPAPPSPDRRRLGVAIERFVFSGSGFRYVIEADCPALRDGFHDVERDGERIVRWTDGAAALPNPPLPCSMTLEIYLAYEAEYLLPPVELREAKYA